VPLFDVLRSLGFESDTPMPADLRGACDKLREYFVGADIGTPEDGPDTVTLIPLAAMGALLTSFYKKPLAQTLWDWFMQDQVEVERGDVLEAPLALQ